MGNVLGYVDARLQVRISPEGLSCDFCERGQNSLENLSRYPTISISISLNPMNWTIQNWLSSSASRTRDSWSFVFDFQEFYSAFTKSKVRLSLDIRVIMFVAKKNLKIQVHCFFSLVECIKKPALNSLLYCFLRTLSLQNQKRKQPGAEAYRSGPVYVYPIDGMIRGFPIGPPPV